MSPPPRVRIRALLPALHLGYHPPGPLNSITDVPNVTAALTTHNIPASPPSNPSSTSASTDPAPPQHHHEINTGTTVLLPNARWFTHSVFAGIHTFNGSGELTGAHWLAETGLLSSPVVLTGSWGVGGAYAGVYAAAAARWADPGSGLADWFLLPVVGETYDGFLNDCAGAVRRGCGGAEEVQRGIERAAEALGREPEAVMEGSVGGGTGMICLGFKAGTGSASRVVPGLRVAKKGEDGEGGGELEKTQFTLGALVQANFGAQRDLRIGGVPVGRLLQEEDEREGRPTTYIHAAPTKGNDDATKKAAAATTTAEKHAQQQSINDQSSPTTQAAPSTIATSNEERAERARDPAGSIIVILATDAPLSATQLQRIAKRATVGVARVGGWGSNYSGDIFLAFSTGNEVPRKQSERMRSVTEVGGLRFVDDQSLNPLFEAAADAVEEAVLNAMCMAQDMKGPLGAEVRALPLERVKKIMERYLEVEWRVG